MSAELSDELRFGGGEMWGFVGHPYSKRDPNPKVQLYR
jgi:hypothetical protein